jgi:GNAT superfamily N-acetyltransferase
VSLEVGTLALVTGSPNGDSGEVTLRTGERVLIRPVRPSDKSLLTDGLERMSTESRYRRFFSPVEHLGTSELRYLTEVDHHRHEALVAVEPETGAAVGVARFVRTEDDSTTAEPAIAVVDDWHRRGLGTELLVQLAERAREEGVTRFSASVLAANSPMLDC